uniref:Uncharacterized protein n=1 Tax=Schistosoma mansoni TaxID=6183 RepID=A0A5K4F578_SCHMA
MELLWGEIVSTFVVQFNIFFIILTNQSVILMKYVAKRLTLTKLIFTCSYLVSHLQTTLSGGMKM